MRSLLFAAIVCSACGGNAEEQAARDTVRLASRALVDVQHTGGEQAALAGPIQDAHDWLTPAQTAVDLWPEGGDVAYREVVNCLGDALAVVRDTLQSVGRDIPTALEQAEAQIRGASEIPCAQ